MQLIESIERRVTQIRSFLVAEFGEPLIKRKKTFYSGVLGVALGLSTTAVWTYDTWMNTPGIDSITDENKYNPYRDIDRKMVWAMGVPLTVAGALSSLILNSIGIGGDRPREVERNEIASLRPPGARPRF